MILETHGNKVAFLEGGGEMGQIIREKNWVSHPLGKPETWPAALKIAIGIMLKTAFPKFIFWGEEHICFYNDAYRPSLGKDGKHPFILGQKGIEAWPEIWDTIKPLIDQVWQTGIATWSENQLIPIYRNGRIENVYWTFSYSPLPGDDQTTGGVLVTCTETTDAVLNLKRLEESEDQLKFAIEAAELGTYDFNPVTNTFTGNARLKEWFGLSQEGEMELQMAIQAIAPEDQERVTVAINKALEGHNKGKYDITYTIVNKKSQKPRTVRALGRVWFNENNEAYRFNGTLQDITEKFKAEQELQFAYEAIQREEKRFRNIVQNAPTGIAIFKGKEPTVEMANATLLQIVDRSSKELVGSPLFDVLPEMRKGIEPLFEEVHLKRKAFRGTEYKIPIKRKGKITDGYFDFVLHPLNTEVDNENDLEVMMVANEVTDYIVARNILAENENQFRNLVLQSPIAMAIFRTEDLRIEMANERMLNHFWKKSWNEVIGKKLVGVFPELKGQKYIDKLTNVIKTGKHLQGRDSKAIVISNDKKEEFYVDYDYLPLTELDGSVSGVMITVTDVTEQYLSRKKLLNFSKELENQVDERTKLLNNANKKLMQSIKKLEMANTELESFAYVSSHDLQEPLRKIQMYTSRIKEQEEKSLTEAGNKYFDKITIAASRMRKLIEDLLTFSRSSDGNAEFEQTDLDLILKQVLEDFSNTIEKSNAKVVYDTLPVVQAIPFQMRQVFANLIGNALKFAKPDTPPEIIIKTKTASAREIASVDLKENTDYHKITIMDKGIGFEKGMEHKIFEVFQRLHGKSEFEGTGIGLAIVNKIIENHGGAVTAASIQGENTTFSIFVPA